jgi:hypothetical protein
MFESKVIVNLALLFAFGGAAFGSVTLWKITTQPGSFLSTTSPKGIYTVKLTGRKDRPKVPFLNHQVLFSVSRNEKVVVANKYLHSGDWFDHLTSYIPTTPGKTMRFSTFTKRSFLPTVNLNR